MHCNAVGNHITFRCQVGSVASHRFLSSSEPCIALVFDAQQGFIPTTDPMDLLYSTSMGGAGIYYQSGSGVTFCLPQIESEVRGTK